jgi:flagellar biosynthesis/type III secretory pathway protein FliH
MPFDDELRQAIETLTDKVRQEAARRVETVTAELTARAAADRVAAVKAAVAEAEARAEEARAAAEQDYYARLTEAADAASAATRSAEERGRTTGHADGYRQGFENGRTEGYAAGHADGSAAGRTEGMEAGRAEGLERGRREGAESGRAEGFASGRAEGIAACRAEGVAAGKEEGLAAGREEGRTAGLEEGRAAGREEGIALGREQGIAVGREAGIAQGRGEGASAAVAATERLVDAVRAIDRSRSLSEVLDTLASSAGREAARVALLIVEPRSLRRWRFIGFGPLDADGPFEVEPPEAGVIADAVNTAAVVAVSASPERRPPSFASLPDGHDLVALPITMGGSVVAVLYADRGGADREDDDARDEGVHPSDRPLALTWRTSLELMARHAARCLETITAFRTAQALIPAAGGRAADTFDRKLARPGGSATLLGEAP